MSRAFELEIVDPLTLGAKVDNDYNINGMFIISLHGEGKYFIQHVSMLPKPVLSLVNRRIRMVFEIF